MTKPSRAAGWYILLCACAICTVLLFILVPPLWPLWVVLLAGIGWAGAWTTVDIIGRR